MSSSSNSGYDPSSFDRDGSAAAGNDRLNPPPNVSGPPPHADSRPPVAPPPLPPPIDPAAPPQSPSRTPVTATPPANPAPPAGPPPAGSETWKPDIDWAEGHRRKRSFFRRFFRKRGRLSTPEAGEQAAELAEERRRMPSWLVSLVVHLVLLLILALIPIQQLVSGPLTLFLGSGDSTALAEFELSGADTLEQALNPDALADESLEPFVDPTQALQEIKLPDMIGTEALASTNALEELPFGIRQGLSGRSGALKAALLAQFGGNQETEDAVELGLQWLAKQQKSDGSWSLVGPYSLGGASENKTAATAMALNAFLGAGHTHREGKYSTNVKLGLAYLVRRQNSEGFFSTREPSRQQMYAQAIASIAVTEAYGMTREEEYKSAAIKAIRFAEWSQSRLRGWRYEPRQDADLSVTGWFLMAMVTAKMSGLPVDPIKFDGVSEYLDSVAFEENSRYAYNDFERNPSLSMTAEGLLCRIYLGWPRTHPALLAAIRDDLLPNKPSFDAEEYSVYYWYYATQVMHHVGGELWNQWNLAMRKVLPGMQEKSGAEAGSWDPSNDMFGASGGRLYVTCLNLYCLEVYYRHLSIYDLNSD